ncbi:UNVERIFIED_CONTAM: hypothetical protein K2H54_056096 [Gekko kuhli]
MMDLLVRGVIRDVMVFLVPQVKREHKVLQAEELQVLKAYLVLKGLLGLLATVIKAVKVVGEQMDYQDFQDLEVMWVCLVPQELMVSPGIKAPEVNQVFRDLQAEKVSLDHLCMLSISQEIQDLLDSQESQEIKEIQVLKGYLDHQGLQVQRVHQAVLGFPVDLDHLGQKETKDLKDKKVTPSPKDMGIN